MDDKKQMDEIWLDGYNLEKLNELQKVYQLIQENEEEQYRQYFDFVNSEYENYKILIKHENLIKELFVSNFGNVIYNGNIIPSTIVVNGPNKGIKNGAADHYREIVFYDLPIKRHAFFTYRLIAETWCNNPNPYVYTTVHHIGNDSYDNKNNLLFVTQKQHFSIRHNRSKKQLLI